jgi:hypothetical protein
MKKISRICALVLLLFSTHFLFSQESIAQDPVEAEISKLFLAHSASNDQILQLVGEHFKGKDVQKAQEHIKDDIAKGFFFVLTTEYPEVKRGFENVLSKSKETHTKSFRYKLKQVYILENYLEKLQTEL